MTWPKKLKSKNLCTTLLAVHSWAHLLDSVRGNCCQPLKVGEGTEQLYYLAMHTT